MAGLKNSSPRSSQLITFSYRRSWNCVLVKHTPARISFSGRNAKRAEAVIEETKKVTPDAAITFIQCDLASLESAKVSI